MAVTRSAAASWPRRARRRVGGRRAYLARAYLAGADLAGADLAGATIETGEKWEQYLREVVPELLKAGGKPLASFAEAWDCHSWTNCPMAHAFDTHDLSGVPILLRPRAEQFIRYFDSKLIPLPETATEVAAAK